METTYESALEQIIQTVFSTMLNFDVVRVYEPQPGDAELMAAAIHIAGNWTGSVVLGMPSETSLAAAAGLLNISEADVTEEDRRDVAAELVNMIGGNLKSLLPGPSFLSLPTVVSGREFGMDVRDAHLIDSQVLRSEHGILFIQLYESDVRGERTNVL